MILKAWGTWELFQDLLAVLRAVGDRHGGASIANVAVRWVLEHPFVGAVIVGKSSLPRFESVYLTHDLIFVPPLRCSVRRSGTRLGISAHTDDNHRVFQFKLTKEDLDEIEKVLDQSNGRRLIVTVGDCGAEYR